MSAAGRLWLAGCGTMAGAMLRRWLSSGLDPAAVTVVRPSGRPVAPGVAVHAAPPAGTPDLLLLGFKPQKLAEAAPRFAPHVGPDTILVSILAGVELATLRRAFPAAGAIVRAMPNTPVAIGEGVVGLFGEGGPEAPANATVAALMAPLGLVEWIADEALFDVVTALAGSGPAFLFRFIDALGAGGAALGLAPDQAARFALATVQGAAQLAARAEAPPAALAEQVASPGGSTRAGLAVLDEAGALARLVEATLAAATRRNAEMAQAARDATA
ncbi:pyrroline-5-carboxylate reductase [Sphingomonas morindae]|uniref:Pyrroline-5-carboxylate reductase n=1 Tax=Sphingomonas morindae TaxID=1541170 RepID=A0ABY4X4V9_9SPHN|nr:pyrroline-5-carboxylate reductase [Sphingomonas morindae]USI71906.1 pyrroline-5-carboxylate reductase [Sphingomonas morindae]